MAVRTDAIIFTALTDHLRTMFPSIPIAGPNVKFPAAGADLPDTYLRVDFLPNQTRQITLGPDPQQKQGILQVAVVVAAGVGIAAALDVAGQVIDLFRNQVLTASDVRITIYNEPWATSPIQEDSRVMIPVTIPYLAFEPET